MILDLLLSVAELTVRPMPLTSVPVWQGMLVFCAMLGWFSIRSLDGATR